MRRAVSTFALAACVLAASLHAAPTRAATYVVWQGQSVLTSVTPACSASGVGRSQLFVGSTLMTVIRPRLLASNGNDSRIAFIHGTQAEFALVLAGGLTISGPGTYAAYGVMHGGMFRTNVGGVYRDFSFSPAAPLIDTPFVSLTGTIEKFMFITDCTVTFRGVYTLRP